MLCEGSHRVANVKTKMLPAKPKPTRSEPTQSIPLIDLSGSDVQMQRERKREREREQEPELGLKGTSRPLPLARALTVV